MWNSFVFRCGIQAPNHVKANTSIFLGLGWCSTVAFHITYITNVAHKLCERSMESVCLGNQLDEKIGHPTHPCIPSEVRHPFKGNVPDSWWSSHDIQPQLLISSLSTNILCIVPEIYFRNPIWIFLCILDVHICKYIYIYMYIDTWII